MKKLSLSMLFICLLLVGYSCSDQEIENESLSVQPDSLELFEYLKIVASSSLSLEAKNSNAKGENPHNKPTVWADCAKYSAIVVPATFKPTSDPFDELYMIPSASFYGGIPLVSDSKPGDQDYNGGRWHLNVIKEGVDTSKYHMVCSEEGIDLDDFESTDMYFECPMLPFR